MKVSILFRISVSAEKENLELTSDDLNMTAKNTSQSLFPESPVYEPENDVINCEDLPVVYNSDYILIFIQFNNLKFITTCIKIQKLHGGHNIQYRKLNIYHL